MGLTWQKNPGEGNQSIDEAEKARKAQAEQDREARIAEQQAKLRAQTDALKDQG